MKTNFLARRQAVLCHCQSDSRWPVVSSASWQVRQELRLCWPKQQGHRITLWEWCLRLRKFPEFFCTIFLKRWIIDYFSLYVTHQFLRQCFIVSCRLSIFLEKKSCNINPFVPQPMSYLWRVKKIQNPAFQSQKMILILQLIAPTHFSGRNRLEFAFSKFKGYLKVYIAITYRVTTVISFLECCIARQVTPAKLGWQYRKLPNSG